METSIFNVNGIQNETEKLQMKKALEKIEGVNKICVDRANNQIEVKYNSQTSEDEIANCIESTGHHIQEQ